MVSENKPLGNGSKRMRSTTVVVPLVVYGTREALVTRRKPSWMHQLRELLHWASEQLALITQLTKTSLADSDCSLQDIKQGRPGKIHDYCYASSIQKLAWVLEKIPYPNRGHPQ